MNAVVDEFGSLDAVLPQTPAPLTPVADTLDNLAIDEGIDVPIVFGPVQQFNYPIEKLTRAGQSFLVPSEDSKERGRIVSRLINQSKKYEKDGAKFRVLRRTAGKEGEAKTGVRIWRIA